MGRLFEKIVEWSNNKNEWLISERNISFEEIIVAVVENNKLLDIIQNNDKYSDQKILVVEINNYVYLCPFIENGDKIFLKTIYPSRKLTKIYLKEV
ncbi:MAG: toxin [Candidatus Acididesulfobacter diazotrophicus]|jgi:uncharacterized DUF497 family protein|uniref:Toxin n=1 Tax=Candidatus Acididesulfobacter diazotrophicus TaxID=2597226 RepID=A0A519BJW5_9DELT|nr:MAG: toxin [Candidatus Acididesulfobacter diazotrophicus]